MRAVRWSLVKIAKLGNFIEELINAGALSFPLTLHTPAPQAQSMKRSGQALFTLLLVLAGAIQSSIASDPNLLAILANGKIQLSWPSDFSHYFLLKASDPVPAAWSELVVPSLITN